MTPDELREHAHLERMSYDDLREHIRLELQAIDATINRLTAIVAEDSAKRGTTPQQITAKEHTLVLCETLRDKYWAAMEAFDHDDAERAGALLDEVEALKTQLFPSSGPP